jgi:hypothetical protein
MNMLHVKHFGVMMWVNPLTAEYFFLGSLTNQDWEKYIDTSKCLPYDDKMCILKIVMQAAEGTSGNTLQRVSVPVQDNLEIAGIR